MKKIYILIFAFAMFSFAVNAQNLLNGDMELWDDTTTPTSWTKAENLIQETGIVHGGTYSAKQTHDGTKDIMQDVTVMPGHSYQVMYYFLDNDPNAKSRIYGGFRDGSDWIGDNSIFQPSTYSTDDASWVEFSETMIAPVGATMFRFEVRTYGDGANGGVIYYDDFSLVDVTPVDPVLEISSPLDNSITTSSDIEINFYTTNFVVGTAGVGDGHIHWEIDGNMTMKYDMDPIQLTGLSLGSHTFMMKLVDDSHADIIPAVSQTISFSVVDGNGTNLVLNGNMESWQDATSINSWTKAENIEQETVTIHSGLYSAKQTHDGTKDLMQDITVIPGHSYEIKYFYYDNSPDARTRIYGGFRNDSGSWVESSDFQPSGYSIDQDVWVEFSAIAVAPATTDTFRLEVRTYSEGAGGGHVFFDDFTIVDLTTVGIKPIATRSLSFYPNPAKEILHLDGNDIKFVQIMDINGKIVKTIDSISSKKTIDISDLKQGIYFIRTENKVSKLIKL